MAGASFSKATIQILLNAQNALKDLKNFQNNFTSGMGNMKTALAGFVGYKGLQGAYDSVKQLTDISDKWRVPTEKMSRFRNLLISMGGDADEAVTSFEKLKQVANQLQFHSSGPLKDLSAIIRTNLAKKDPEALITALRTQWPMLNNDAQEEVLRMLGTDSVGMRNLLRASETEYAAAQQKASRMPVVTEQDAQAARDIKKYSEETANNTNKILSVINNIFTKNLLRTTAGATSAIATPGTTTIGDAKDLAIGVTAAGAGAAIAGKTGGGVLGLLGKWAGGNAGGWLSGASATASAGGASLASVLGIAGVGMGIGFGITHLANKLSDNADERQQRLKRLTAGNYSNLEQYWQDLAWTGYDVKKGNGIWTGNTAITDEELLRSDTLLKKRVSDFVAQAALHDPDSLSRNWKSNKDFQELVKKYAPQTVNQTINIYGIKGAEDIAPALRSVVMQNMSPTQGYGG